VARGVEDDVATICVWRYAVELGEVKVVGIGYGVDVVLYFADVREGVRPGRYEGGEEGDVVFDRICTSLVHCSAPHIAQPLLSPYKPKEMTITYLSTPSDQAIQHQDRTPFVPTP
jgi:hypothetical protein